MAKDNKILTISKKIINYAVFPLTLAIVVGLSTPGSFIYQAFNNDNNAIPISSLTPNSTKLTITPYGLGNYTVYVDYTAPQVRASRSTMEKHFKHFKDTINAAIAQKKGLRFRYNTTFDNGNNSEMWGVNLTVK
ncbi:MULTISPECIES: hypothetical protein [Lacticaseibacillus]|uniref:hypothetical protein n=1 Tax=Lacticaseibacillus TaxID=2759736 RepID=UPI00063DBC14|nr:MULTISPECIES: hypothetical protein [Lacticaseibacillus]KLI77107.1 hypothetical protein AAW28_01235 [Lacticaseibacillus casei]